MTMKMFNKAECEYKSGYIVCNGEVVCIDNEIVDLFNKLDVDVQRARYEAQSCAGVAAPADEFRPCSEHGAVYPVIEVETPELDKMTDRTMKMMDEIDTMANATKANEYIAGILPLCRFVGDDFIVSAEHSTQHRFDLPAVGNPLELDKEKLSDLIIEMFE